MTDVDMRITKLEADLAFERRDKARLWDNYRHMGRLYHKALDALRSQQRELAAREFLFEAFRYDLREAMREDEGRKSRSVVGPDGIGALVGKAS